LPAGIEATGEAARSAARALDQQSSSQLKVGAAFSIGVATGLLVGGGPRILVVLAGLPGVAMLMALADRRREAGTT
jgi:hypothetical protein